MSRGIKNGLIVKQSENNPGRPLRNVYSITPAGKDELIAWLLRPIEHTPQRLELPLKLTFAKMIPPENTIQELERILDRHRKDLTTFRQTEENFMSQENIRKDKGYPYWLATLRYGIYDAEFRIRWCEETIERIKSIQN